MKFWELIGLFKDEIEVLETVLGEKKWHLFQDMFYDFDFLMQSSESDVLDKIVPNELLLKLAGQSKQQFSFDSNENVLKKYEDIVDVNIQVLSMQVAIENYGYDFLEAIQAHGFYKLPV